MARAVDIIIFGATGFTGQHAIPFLSKFSKTYNLTWGIAGRSEKKLRDVLNSSEKQIGSCLSNIPIIIASINDEVSLSDMASKTRLVINCCGPYRFFGEPVVKACIEQGTHHIDVSGEPQYMEEMQLKYHKQAQKKGVYIISACGVDSIPIDLGVVFLQQQFNGTLNSINTYLSTWQEGEPLPGPTFNYATWQSLVYGFAHSNQLQELRKRLHSRPLPSFKPKLQAKRRPFKTDLEEGWAFPFLGADRSVVKRSQRCFYENEGKRPLQIETYFMMTSYISIAAFYVLGYISSILAKSSGGRSLLLKYPEIFTLGFFSHKPPSEEKVEKSWFKFILSGEGWKERVVDGADDQCSSPPDRTICGRVVGRNPGYGAASICLVLAGITVLTETDKMPPGGGVLPPGYAFARTSLIERLNENDIRFEILFEKDLKLLAKY